MITLTDDGNGMTAVVASRLFEPFFTTARSRGGSGLGMSIVHDLVTSRLGGRIDLLSAPGEGAVFTLTLPLSLPNSAGGSASPGQEQ